MVRSSWEDSRDLTEAAGDQASVCDTAGEVGEGVRDRRLGSWDLVQQ